MLRHRQLMSRTKLPKRLLITHYFKKIAKMELHCQATRKKDRRTTSPAMQPCFLPGAAVELLLRPSDTAQTGRCTVSRHKNVCKMLRVEICVIVSNGIIRMGKSISTYGSSATNSSRNSCNLTKTKQKAQTYTGGRQTRKKRNHKMKNKHKKREKMSIWNGATRKP